MSSRSQTTTFDPHRHSDAARLEAARAELADDHDTARLWRRHARNLDVRDLARRLGGDARAWALVAMQIGRPS